MFKRGLAAAALLLVATIANAQTGPGTSPLSIAKGGTSASTAAGARTALGLTIGTAVQAWDTDLDCLAALSTAGLAARTGAGTCATRVIVAPAAGITVTNGDGVAGNPTLALANDLAALEALSGTGIAVRTATDTWVQRAIAGTANEISVANGDGVAGAPTVGLPNAITLTGKTLTGGTFTGPAIAANDNALTLRDDGDATKQLQFQLSGLTTGTLRTLIVPDASTTLVGTDTAQTLTNKSIVATQLTGTLQAAQVPALTGDVTTPGGSLASTIAANAVTYAKMQQVAASSLIGNPTGSTANAQGVTLGSTLAFSGSELRTGAGTGDVSWSANSFSTTLATVNSNVGSFGSATQCASLTVNAKGLVTAISATTCAPAWSSIASKPTTVSGFGITDALVTTNNLSDLSNSATARTNIGLGNVDNTSDAIKNSASATLTNKTISGSSNTLTVLAGTQLSGQVPVANGGTGQSTAPAARGSSGLNIFGGVDVGDADHTILATDRGINLTTTLTAVRTLTLPAANAVNKGEPILISDAAGAINGSNTITVARAGSDTINGISSVSISAQYGVYLFFSDGSSKWTYLAAGTGGGGGSGTVTSVDASCGLKTSSGSAITTSGTIVGSRAVNAQTGTTYTVLDGDCGKLVTTSNASAIAITLPQAGASSQFVAGWSAIIANIGAGTATITPTTSTINGAASLALATNQATLIVSDGTNYRALLFRNDLGTAATKDVGTSANNVVQLNASAQLPAVDGSLLTGIVTGKKADQQVFTSSGTWTKPSGFSSKAYSFIQCWGGGGGASRAASTSSLSGGGGGQYSQLWILLSSLGSTETVTIGAGGAGRTGSAGEGSAGGTTTFGSFFPVYGGGGGSSTGYGARGGSPMGAGVAGSSTNGVAGSLTTDGATYVLPPLPAWQGGYGKSATSYPARLHADSLMAGAGGGSANSTAGGTSIGGGNGGTAAATAGAGSVPGGGGASSTNVNTDGGSGAAGKCIVTVFDGA